MKKHRSFAAILLLLMIFFQLNSTLNSMALSISDILKIGESLDIDNGADPGTMSDNVIRDYALSGIFDEEGRNCSSELSTMLSNNSTAKVKDIPYACANAIKYQETNERYSKYAQTGLKQYDKSNGRLNAALEVFNKNAQFVYGILTGFGCLTALLVFIIIFVRITWLPEHATQRRKAMEDIVTSGVSVILLGGFWLVIGVFQSIFNRFWESYTVYSTDWVAAGNIFLGEYKKLIVGILGLATLTALLMFIKTLTSIVVSGFNPQKKSEKMMQLLYCGLATAGLGGLTLVAGLFWNMLR